MRILLMKTSTANIRYLNKYIKDNKDNKEKVKEAEYHIKQIQNRKRKHL